MMLTSSTRSPLSGPVVSFRVVMLSCVLACSRTSDFPPELQQRDVVGHVLVLRLHAHADPDVADRAVEQVRREPRTFIQLDLNDSVRHTLFEPGCPGLVID